MLKPKLFTTLKEYTLKQFINDLIAGIIVGIIALPLSIALSIASGVSPEKGLITAAVGGFFISFFGGSRVQIGGPTGAFVIIVFNIIQQHGMKGLVISTLMAGCILILMGLLKFGSMIKFVPWPITTGFTSGIAIVILSTQLKDFTGITTPENPTEFFEKIKVLIEYSHTINFQVFAIGLISFLLIYFWPKRIQIIPGTLVAIILCTLLNIYFNLNVETIGSRFGRLSVQFSLPDLSGISFPEIQQLLPSALIIAILAGIESLLSAVVTDGMIGGKHRPNIELVAQGIGNLASAFVGGIPATGAIARSAANVNNGGRTPVSGIVHSIVIFLLMFLFMPYASLIPMSCLAAILINVAIRMGEWKAFKELLKAPKSDLVVFIMTFVLTIIFDLVVAIEVGIVLAAVLFMKRMADVTDIRSITEELKDLPEIEDPDSVLMVRIPEDVQIYEVNGPFFFGAANRFIETMEGISKFPKVFILRMRHVPAMDATGYNALRRLKLLLKKHGSKLILSGVCEQPYKLITKAGFVDELGAEYISLNLNDALEKAKNITS